MDFFVEILINWATPQQNQNEILHLCSACTNFAKKYHYEDWRIQRTAY